ncbi:MAG: flagellar basal body rod protein FlgC [Pseudohongiellaceae bacterium]
MSLFNVFDSAGSALNAHSIRLNTTSSNLANANSASSSDGETYRARHPVFAPIMQQLGGDGSSVGVRVQGIVESQEPLRMEHNPGHPLANEEGYIFLPNVNVVEEMANMISASRAYQTNVEVMNSAKQMMMRTLALGQ